MIKYLKIAGVVLLASVAAFVVSCSKSNSPVASQNTDQSYFESVMNGNDSQTSDLMTSAYTAFDDGAMYSVAMGSQPVTPAIQSFAADTGIMPLKWGRFITGVTRAITSIDTEGDSVAIVTVQAVVTGYFKIFGVVSGTNDTETISKPFTLTLQRSLRFVRIAHGDDAFSNWRLDAVTVLHGGTANSQIMIKQVQVIPPTGDTLSVEDTDVNTYFMQLAWRWMHRLPLWGWNVQVTVNATVHSASPDTDIVALNWVPKFSDAFHRGRMTLVSSTADSGGYTRMYSATFIIPGIDKKFSHAVVTAMTHESLYTATVSNFSVSLWGVPYKSQE